MMKEKKSGLFVKEQVLSLACGDKDDVDDDIDILTWWKFAASVAVKLHNY